MGRLGRFIFLRTAIAFAAVLATLTGIVWVTQALRRFDLVTAKGQAIAAYLAMTLLAIPFLVGIVAPFALVIAMAVVLNAMHADSELVAMHAAGASHRRLFRPFLLLAAGVTLLVGWIALSLGPISLQQLRDMTNAVRADIVANVIQPGRFIEIDDGLTFHIRNRAGDGSLEGLFIHDHRDPAISFTYTAERGRVVEAMGRTLVVMETGTVERLREEDGAATFVAFGSYAFDLSELRADGQAAPYKVNERTMTDLLMTPADDPYRASRADQFAAEIHVRFSTMLWPLTMVLAAYMFLGLPRTTRSGRGLAVIGALASAALARLIGFATAGVAGNRAELIPLVYAAPAALIALFGTAVWTGRSPRLPAWLASALLRAGESLAGLTGRFRPGGGS